MRKIFMLLFVLALSLSVNAQRYRNTRNSGFLIDKSSAGHYNPNVGNSSVRSNSSSSGKSLLEMSSAGHYDGPVNTTPTYTESTSSSSSSGTTRQCYVCKGKGWYVHTQYMGAAVAGKKKWCNDCGEVEYGHSHRHCESCHGQGYTTN